MEMPWDFKPVALLTKEIARSVIEKYAPLYQQAESSGDELGQVICLLHIGSAYIKLQAIHKASKEFKYALELASNLGESRLMAIVRVRIGMIDLFEGKFQSAHDLLKPSWDILIKYDDQVNLGFSALKLAEVYKRLNQYEESLRYSEIGLKSARSQNDHDLYSLGLLDKAQCFQFMDRMNEAIIVYEQAIASATQESSQTIALGFARLGELYFDLWEFRKSLSYFQKSLLHWQQLDNLYNICACLCGFGLAHEALRDYKMAVTYYDDALKKYRTLFPDTHPALINVKVNRRRCKALCRNYI